VLDENEKEIFWDGFQWVTKTQAQIENELYELK
jgi:RNA recognition motif-containing protein